MLRVEVQQLPWTAAHQKLLTAFAGDSLPDVAQLGNTWRLIRETGGWHADIPALRALYPELTSLRDWLARGGVERIIDRLDTTVAATPFG